MPHEFYDCLRTGCYISNTLTKKPYVSVWFQRPPTQTRKDYHEWQFYVEWRPGKGSHVTRPVCDKHNDEIAEIAGDEVAAEVREQEATERWLIKCNSQMLTPL